MALGSPDETVSDSLAVSKTSRTASHHIYTNLARINLSEFCVTFTIQEAECSAENEVPHNVKGKTVGLVRYIGRKPFRFLGVWLFRKELSD